MHGDAERWDARHRHGGAPTPAPPDALAGRPDLLALIPTTGIAFDVACGLGSQTLWLAGRGLRVVALDVSPIAVASVLAAAATTDLSARIDARVTDLDTGLPAEPALVDVIVCQRFRQPALYPRFVDRLRPAGIAIVTVLSEVGADAPGTFHAPAGELLTAFDRPGVAVLDHEERAGQATVVFRRL